MLYSLLYNNIVVKIISKQIKPYRTQRTGDPLPSSRTGAQIRASRGGTVNFSGEGRGATMISSLSRFS